MTRETIKRGNDLISEISYCEQVREHVGKGRRLFLKFETTRDCIESYDSMRCPDWLVETILEAVRKRQEETERELEEL